MFKSPRLIALLAILWLGSASYAQDRLIDSLKTAIANPKLHDTTRLTIIHEVASTRFTNNFDPKFHQVIDMMGALALKNYNNKNNSPKLQKKYTLGSLRITRVWLRGMYSKRSMTRRHAITIRPLHLTGRSRIMMACIPSI